MNKAERTAQQEGRIYTNESVGALGRGKKQVLKAAEAGGEDDARHGRQQRCVERKQGVQGSGPKRFKARLGPI